MLVGASETLDRWWRLLPALRAAANAEVERLSGSRSVDAQLAKLDQALLDVYGGVRPVTADEFRAAFITALREEAATREAAGPGTSLQFDGEAARLWRAHLIDGRPVKQCAVAVGVPLSYSAVRQRMWLTRIGDTDAPTAQAEPFYAALLERIEDSLAKCANARDGGSAPVDDDPAGREMTVRRSPARTTVHNAELSDIAGCAHLWCLLVAAQAAPGHDSPFVYTSLWLLNYYRTTGKGPFAPELRPIVLEPAELPGALFSLQLGSACARAVDGLPSFLRDDSDQATPVDVRSAAEGAILRPEFATLRIAWDGWLRACACPGRGDTREACPPHGLMNRLFHVWLSAAGREDASATPGGPLAFLTNVVYNYSPVVGFPLDHALEG